MDNFVLRTGAALEQLIVLIRHGALQSTGVGKKELLKSDYKCTVKAMELYNLEGQTRRIVCDFVSYKHVQTKNGQHMKFGTFILSMGIRSKVVKDFGSRLSKKMCPALKPDP